MRKGEHVSANKPDAKGGGDRNPNEQNIDADATSSETIGDLDAAEKASADAGGAPGATDRAETPSPDGAFDEGGRGDASGRNDAGPM